MDVWQCSNTDKPCDARSKRRRTGGAGEHGAGRSVCNREATTQGAQQCAACCAAEVVACVLIGGGFGSALDKTVFI